MAKITLKTIKGDMIVEGRKFAHYIGNIRHWFAYHTPLGQSFGTQITHIETGFRVCEVGNGTIGCCRNDVKAAAKMELDRLIQRVGVARFESAIRTAKVTKLEPEKEESK